jgi:hypothetical protein
MFTMKIAIPATLDGAVTSLEGLTALLTAKQWERAAIVYAFTENGGRGRPTTVNDGNPPFTLSDFAEFGIAGLRNREQVARYRSAWQKAVDAGAPEVKPGDVIEFEPPAVDIEWKEAFGEQTTDVQERVARQVLRERPEVVADAIPAAIAKVIEADPGVGAQFVKQAVDATAKSAEGTSRIADVVADSRIGERVHSLVVDKHDNYREGRDRRESFQKPATRVVEKLIASINGFYDQTLLVQGEPRTYREIVQFVLDNPDLSLPNGELIVTGDLRQPLLTALENLRADTTKMLDALALTAGEAQN